jgi:hypothetical protein
MPEPNQGMPADENITVSRDYSIPVPRRERAYFIPASDWGRLKKMISRIAPPKNWFQIGASLCAGTCLTSILGLLGSDHPSFGFKLVAWIFILCGGILAITLFYLDSQQRQDLTQSANDVTDEMRQLENSNAAVPPQNAPSARDAEAEP